MLQHLDQILTLALNGSQSLYADALAMTVTQTVTWLPLTLLLLYLIIRNNDLTGILCIILGFGLCILLADQMASTVFKPLVARYRPSQDPLLMYEVDVVNGYRGGRYGFFSSHAANTMAVATFFSLLVRNRTLSLWLYIWALLNCWSRVYLGVHYTGDLLVGTLWGILVGWGVYSWGINRIPGLRQRRQLISTRQGFTPGGYSTASVHLFISGIALTFLSVAFTALIPSS